MSTWDDGGIPSVMEGTDIADQIRARRAAARLTQQQLADLADVHRRTIVMLEAPNTDGGHLSSLRKVAAALGCRVTLEPAQ